MKQLLAIWLAVLFLTVAPILAQMAWAQQANCGPLDVLLMRLTIQYGERPLVVGATPSGGKFMLLTNSDTGSWTIIVVTAPDTACVSIAGDGLVTAKPSKPGVPL